MVICPSANTPKNAAHIQFWRSHANARSRTKGFFLPMPRSEPGVGTSLVFMRAHFCPFSPMTERVVPTNSIAMPMSCCAPAFFLGAGVGGGVGPRSRCSQMVIEGKIASQRFTQPVPWMARTNVPTKAAAHSMSTT